MTPPGDYFDPDEDVRDSSPGLVPTKINYKPVESPPPFIPSSSSSSASASPDPDGIEDHRHGLDNSIRPAVKKRSKRKRRKKKRRTRPSQGDAVLISYLDPNRPDIAQESTRRPLNSASQSEAGDEADEDMSGGGSGDESDEDDKINAEHRNSSRDIELKKWAEAALNDVAMEDAPTKRPVLSPSLAFQGATNNAKEHGRDIGVKNNWTPKTLTYR